MDMNITIEQIAERALRSSRKIAALTAEQRNKLLLDISKSINNDREKIKKANELDIKNAVLKNLSSAMLDRLKIDDLRINSLCEGIEKVVKLDCPTGRILSSIERPNGLIINKVTVPIGVITIIYESRPNVTVDSAVLCLKSGNAVILRGGSESINTNIALSESIENACNVNNISDVVQLIKTTSHEAVSKLLKLNNYIDLVIPRGGESLIRKVTEESTIPVIKHYKGVCSIYVDCETDFELALKIIKNSKCQRPGVCNALENLLINRKIAKEFSMLVDKAIPEVELRGDNEFCRYVGRAEAASEDDWSTEYLELILSVKIVDGVKEAVEFINKYGSRHSDSIITNNKDNADYFMREVDSSTVYHNASTRFTDGFEFGMGAEIGISTDKLHARGPMGLNELTTYKYLVYGTGQIRN